MSKKPLVVLLVEPSSDSRHEMAKIKHFLNEIQVSLNYIEILGVDYQMSTRCGDYELNRSPKKAYFSCVIDIYFFSFFYDHPAKQNELPT